MDTILNHPKVQELDNRISSIEHLDIDTRIHALEEYQEHCEVKHNGHIEIHSISVAKQLELINRTIETQDRMTLSIKNLADNVASISKFINSNEEVLDLLGSVITGFRGLRKIILGTAAIVAALGIILGAGLATWSIFNAPSILDALVALRSIQ